MNPSSSSPVGSAKKRRKTEITPRKEIDSPSWLPEGWKKFEKTREKGRTRGMKDTYYLGPHSGHLFRSIPEVKSYIETGQIPKPKSKPRQQLQSGNKIPKPKSKRRKQLQSGNNDFLSLCLHSAFEGATLESADLKNNDINFNKVSANRESDKEQNQRSNPHLKSVNIIEFLKADGVEGLKKNSNDDFSRKKFLLDLDLNKIPDDTNIPFDSACDAKEQVYSLQNSVNVGVTDAVVVEAGEQKSPPSLKNDLISNTFPGYASLKPEASLLHTEGQTNDHCLAQAMQNMNIDFSAQPSHYVRPMKKSLVNIDSFSFPPAQRKVIPIHDPASPCSVLPAEKQSDKQKTTVYMERKNKNRPKTTGEVSKFTRKESKRHLAELGRKLCKKVCKQNQTAAETLVHIMNSKP